MSALSHLFQEQTPNRSPYHRHIGYSCRRPIINTSVAQFLCSQRIQSTVVTASFQYNKALQRSGVCCESQASINTRNVCIAPGLSSDVGHHLNQSALEGTYRCTRTRIGETDVTGYILCITSTAKACWCVVIGNVCIHVRESAAMSALVYKILN